MNKLFSADKFNGASVKTIIISIAVLMLLFYSFYGSNVSQEKTYANSSSAIAASEGPRVNAFKKAMELLNEEKFDEASCFFSNAINSDRDSWSNIKSYSELLMNKLSSGKIDTFQKNDFISKHQIILKNSYPTISPDNLTGLIELVKIFEKESEKTDEPSMTLAKANTEQETKTILKMKEILENDKFNNVNVINSNIEEVKNLRQSITTIDGAMDVKIHAWLEKSVLWIQIYNSAVEISNIISYAKNQNFDINLLNNAENMYNSLCFIKPKADSYKIKMNIFDSIEAELNNAKKQHDNYIVTELKKQVQNETKSFESNPDYEFKINAYEKLLLKAMYSKHLKMETAEIIKQIVKQIEGQRDQLIVKKLSDEFCSIKNTNYNKIQDKLNAITRFLSTVGEYRAKITDMNCITEFSNLTEGIKNYFSKLAAEQDDKYQQWVLEKIKSVHAQYSKTIWPSRETRALILGDLRDIDEKLLNFETSRIYNQEYLKIWSSFNEQDKLDMANVFMSSNKRNKSDF